MKNSMIAIEKAKVLIKKFEGYRKRPYKCPAGIDTVGWGHTLPKNSGIKGINKNAAEELLSDDIEEVMKALNKYVKVSVTVNMVAALTSFVFNLGATNFRRSTLLRRLNKKLYVEAGDEFLKWTYVGKSTYRGLVLRRHAERDLFLTPNFTGEGNCESETSISK